MKSVGIVLYFFFTYYPLWVIGSQGKKRYFRVQEIKYIE